MDKEKLLNIWYYYLTIEKDMHETSQYIEPLNQEDTYSFAFYKVIVLSCTEIETIFKIITKSVSGVEKGNIADYKCDILSKYPKIVNSKVYVERWGKTVEPFSTWSTGKLEWWDAYSHLKHNRKDDFNEATYKNAVYCLCALYVLILYLAKIFNIDNIDGSRSTYITSEYCCSSLLCSPNSGLPDFELKKEEGVLNLETSISLNKR